MIAPIVIAVALLLLAGYFALKQQATLRTARNDPAYSDDDREYLLRQGRRRMLGSVLMVLFAALLFGWFFIEPHLPQPGDNTPEARERLRLLIAYWAVALLVLLSIMMLAVVDFMATARYGLRKHRELSDLHRSQMEAEADRLRRRSD